MFCPQCPACGEAVIAGRDKCVDACGQRWHADHFRCAATGVLLDGEEFFERDGLPYCRDAFYEKFGERCAACGDIVTGDLLRAADRAYHPDCFVCHETGESLAGRAFYLAEDGEIYGQDAFRQKFADPRVFLGGETNLQEDVFARWASS